jgi:ABC-type sugar transport system permease subunit
MAVRRSWPGPRRGMGRSALAVLLLLPAALLTLGVVGYPLLLEGWFSVSTARVGSDGTFVGLANFTYLAELSTFREVLGNTVVYTAGSTVVKAILGLAMALALARPFRGRRLVTALLFLPFVFPVVLGTAAWYFLLTNVHGGIDYLLVQAHLTGTPIDWKGAGPLPMVSVVTVNVWHGTAVFGLLLWAGLRSIGGDVMDAALVDGAGTVARFAHVVLPLLRPALLLAVVLSTLGTFGDFAIVELLTGGGPLNHTSIVSTFAYENALIEGDLGVASAASFFMAPAYLLGVVLAFRLLRRP